MINRTVADSSADLVKLTDMIHALLRKAWGDEWQTRFGPEYPKKADMEAPFIAYHTKSRVYTTGRGVKPRLFEEAPDPKHIGHTIGLYMQSFDCQMQFDIFHQTGKDADALLQRFEEFLTTYTGYFKQNGIDEFLFQEQLEDDYDFRWRENYYVRSLVYFVRVQRITPIPTYVLHTVELDADVELPRLHTSVEIQP